MKFSEQWLREWVDPPITTDELVDRLTMAGLEVDSVEPAAPAFQGVVVGEVLDVSVHPDADKLRVCRVKVGESEPLQVVCGAPNVHQAMRAPMARVGAQLPGEIKIKPAKLRGVESFGMLCSARELGLGQDQQGLMALPADAPIGNDLRDFLTLDDQTIDIDLTPNRGDCLGIAGIAREVALLTQSALTRPKFGPVQAGIDDEFPVEVTASGACPRYLGRVIRDVYVTAETPLWMKERLRRSGIRSLGPVVDVTNFVLLELGQPMHAFDLQQLHDCVRVRMAGEGERLTLLDGRQIQLAPDTLLISDSKGPLALAGIMGGELSGVTDQTKALFLECAFFSPDAIAGRARRYSLQTDSSYRFERGVDPELQFEAMERATELLLSLVGGTAGPITEVTNQDARPARHAIELRQARVRRVLGIDLKADEITGILERLGAVVETEADGWSVVPPTYRFDIVIEADLIEELGRVHGYDRIPSTSLSGHISMPVVSETQVPRERLVGVLVERSYQEAITYSFVDPQVQSLINPDSAVAPLSNPISAEMSVMRTSLWPGLLEALKHNLNRQRPRVRLFEYGLRFIQQHNEIKQDNMIAGLVFGAQLPEQWGADNHPADFYDVKADVEALLALGGMRGEYSFEADRHPALHPGQCARIIGHLGQPVGWLGRIHPELAAKLDVPSETLLFELMLTAIGPAITPTFQVLSRFPMVRRDLAVLVDRDVTATKVRDIVTETSGDWLRELRLFDVYEGQGIESRRKSLALGLILQDSSRTLTDEDVDGVIKEVTAALNNKLGATLRE